MCQKLLYFTRDLGGEVASHLLQEGVNPLASILVNRSTDGPDEAEDEPELHHPTQVLCVRSIHLELQRELHFFTLGMLKQFNH